MKKKVEGKVNDFLVCFFGYPPKCDVTLVSNARSHISERAAGSVE